MTRVPASLIAAAALLALAACADSATKIAAPVDLQPSLNSSPEFNSNHYKHVMKLSDEGKKDVEQSEKDAKDAANNNAKLSGSGIYYHGGPLIVNPFITKVVAVYWSVGRIYDLGPVASKGAGSGDASLIGTFLSTLGASAYFGINTTYYNGSNAHVLQEITYTSYWATGTAPPSSPNDGDMVALLQLGFDTGQIAYDANTVYAIFTGSGVNLGGGFGSQYCAYHTNGTLTGGQTVLFAAMPHNQDFPSGCTSSLASPNVDVASNSEVNTLAHEIEETTTDPLGTAWWDRRGYENADKCAWTWGTTYTTGNGGVANMNIAGKDYLVQRNWKNAGSGGCVLSLP